MTKVMTSAIVSKFPLKPCMKIWKLSFQILLSPTMEKTNSTKS